MGHYLPKNVQDYFGIVAPAPIVTTMQPLSVCQQCGCLVGDMEIHDRWHGEL